jgi:hypothetical protein
VVADQWNFTSVSFQYPVYSTGKTEPNAITSTLVVTDEREDKSMDHLVKVPVVEQVRQQIADDLQSTGRVRFAGDSQTNYSLQVEIEELKSEIPGYATRSVTNALLREATMGLSDLIAKGTGISVRGEVRLHARFSESGNQAGWDGIFSGEHEQMASMGTAKSHAVEASVLTFALQEAIAKLKARALSPVGNQLQ